MLSRFFIDRPIFASVLSIVITIAGLVAAFTLPIAQYPDITPPTVHVACVYPGANAKVVADTVAAPIEQQVIGVEDMLYMSSQCTNDGAYSLTITFKLGTDLDMAQVRVQNRVAMAVPNLPEAVRQTLLREWIGSSNFRSADFQTLWRLTVVRPGPASATWRSSVAG